MSKTEQRREHQRQALLEAAEKRMAKNGLASLRTRDLSNDIGVAHGAIYNLVTDMDEIILRVASKTLGRLDIALEQSAEYTSAGHSNPVAILIAIARTYHHFAVENLHVWRALFEHRMALDATLPDWLFKDQMRLFRHILVPLEALATSMREEERILLAKTMFSAVHGVVALGLDEKIVAVPRDMIDSQLEILVEIICAGIQARQ